VEEEAGKQVWSQERSLDLFYSMSPTNLAAGEAWLKRIAARKLDREPDSKPQR
jgi:hypothetical protein